MIMSSQSTYCENWHPSWAPLVFFLPIFYTYTVLIENDTLTFGYGFKEPSSLTSVQIPIHCTTTSTTKIAKSTTTNSSSNEVMNKDCIDISTIITGTASTMDNLMHFGGWGIRYGRGKNGKFTRAYNAANGSYIEFTTKVSPHSTL